MKKYFTYPSDFAKRTERPETRLPLWSLLMVLLLLQGCRSHVERMDLRSYHIEAHIDVPAGTEVKDPTYLEEGGIGMSMLTLHREDFEIEVLQNSGAPMSTAQAMASQRSVLEESERQPTVISEGEDHFLVEMDFDGRRGYQIVRVLEIENGFILFISASMDQSAAERILEIMQSAV